MSEPGTDVPPPGCQSKAVGARPSDATLSAPPANVTGVEVRSGPRRNRVTPLGEIVAIPLRGAWLGNRGVLHDGTSIVRPYRSLGWVTCALTYQDWRLPQWVPNRMTVLFFHDEAVALAAGHRPCALCRRPAYTAFRAAWAEGLGIAEPTARDLDRRLHSDRFDRAARRPRRYRRPWTGLPDGTFVVTEDDTPALVRGDAIIPWTTNGYDAARPRPTTGTVVVATPRSTVAALAAGYRPHLDAAAWR